MQCILDLMGNRNRQNQSPENPTDTTGSAPAARAAVRTALVERGYNLNGAESGLRNRNFPGLIVEDTDYFNYLSGFCATELGTYVVNVTIGSDFSYDGAIERVFSSLTGSAARGPADDLDLQDTLEARPTTLAIHVERPADPLAGDVDKFSNQVRYWYQGQARVRVLVLREPGSTVPPEIGIGLRTEKQR